ncbi:MAG: RHS repeat-associated core domain-containing protein, partial [Bdellovibrionales bacterium]|nr:RHS repeat-associated core domain-containing protein [Bdellovibrionales bacterium]
NETANSVSHIHYIQGPDGLAAIYTSNELPSVSPGGHVGGAGGGLQRTLSTTSQSVSTLSPGVKEPSTGMRYLSLDHLGSIQTVSNDEGKIVEVLSFDAWGNRRDPLTWTPLSQVKSKLTKGFTGHEHLDTVGLIHMNGRIYDPKSARFVSADPFIQSPYDLQSYNRYSYVLNNPLSLTDPSGYFSFKKFFKKAFKVFKKVAVAAAVVASAYFGSSFFISIYAQTAMNATLLCTTAYSSIGTGALVAVGGAGAGFTSAITSTLLQGGDLGDAFQNGLKGLPQSILKSVVNFQIGNLTEGSGLLENAFSHGIADAGLATISGQNAKAALISGIAGTYGAHSGPIAAMLAGGTAAAISGGKFENGALNATFNYLFNRSMHPFTSLNWNVNASPNLYGYPPYSTAPYPDLSNALSLYGQELLGVVDGIGAFVSQNSTNLKLLAKVHFRIADQWGWAGALPRFTGVMIGTLGVVGASPQNPTEAILNANFVKTLVEQSIKIYYPPSSF